MSETTTAEIEVNLNQMVRVRLKREGVNHFYKWHERLGIIADLKLEQDGTYRLPLWECMQIFGETLGMGFNAPLETNITIEP